MGPVVLLAAALGLAGCGDDEPGYDFAAGGGLEFLLPAEAAGRDVLLELWDTDAVRDNGAPALPPDCVPATAGRGAVLAAAEPEQEVCSRLEVNIWDFGNRLVRFEEEVPFDVAAWPWDGRDDAGNEVPSGLYPTLQPCLDTEFGRYAGHYFVFRDRERDRNTARGTCEWPLWIREIAAVDPATLPAFGPMPPTTIAWAVDGPGKVTFSNPYRVRVRVDGFEVFETDVELVDRYATEVRVTLVPATTGTEEPRQ